MEREKENERIEESGREWKRVEKSGKEAKRWLIERREKADPSVHDWMFFGRILQSIVKKTNFAFDVHPIDFVDSPLFYRSQVLNRKGTLK